MSLALHIFKKDFRHLRLILLVWAVVLVAQAFLAFSELAWAQSDRLVQGIVTSLSVILPMLQFVLLLALVPLVVQDEPLVGTTAFWLTRPISGPALLVAKSLFIAVVLILVPLVVDLFSLAANGVIPRHLALVTPAILFEKLWLVLPLWVLAVLTINFARFAVVGGITFVGLLLTSLAIISAKLLMAEDVENTMVSIPGTGAVLLTVAPLLLGAVVIGHQYLTRKTGRSLLILGSTILFMFLVPLLWSEPAARFRPTPVDRSILNPERIHLSLDLKSVSTSDAFYFRSREPAKEVMSNLDIQGVPPGYVLNPWEIRTSLRFPDGKTVNSKGYWSYFLGNQWNPDAVAHVLGGVALSYGSQYRPQESWRFRVYQSLYQHYGTVPGTLLAQIQFSVSHLVVVARLPVRRGERFKKGSDYFAVTDVLRDPGGVSVIVREGRLRLFTDQSLEERLKPVRLYALVNSRRGEAVLPTESSMDSWMLLGGFSIGRSEKRFNTSSVILRFSSEGSVGKSITVDQDWVAGSQLVRLEVDDIGGFSKQLRVENFRMAPEAGK